MIKSFLPLFTIVLLSNVPAFGCEIGGFDIAPPSAKNGTSGPTDKTHFEWGSDVDPYGNEYIYERSWHYIQNIHDQHLSLNWIKPGLLIPFDSPLAPGDCRSAYEYGEEGAFEADYDAPIITSNDGEKNAAAYVKSDKIARKEIPEITGAGIQANYRTEDNERANAIARLIVYYFPADQFMELNVFTGEGGESMAFRPKSLGLTFDKVSAQLSESDVTILERSSLSEMIKYSELSDQAFKKVEKDDFIRISVEDQLTIKFSGVSDIPSGRTSILLFSPHGSLLLAKRLIISAFSESDN